MTPAQPCYMFLLRWYQEVDKAGINLPGYQIRSCAGCKLPYDNGGEPSTDGSPTSR